MNANACVYVVDDDPAVRNSIRWLLESVRYRTCCCASADDFLKAFDSGAPGCLLLDVRMPGMSGLDLQSKLLDEKIGIPVIVFTGHADVPMAVRALKNGAFDFIEKPFNDQVLLDRVASAVKQDADRIDAQRLKSGISERLGNLTRREVEVMRLVVEGRSNKAIATQLGLSPKTIEVHRAHVMDKMGARSLADLVRFSVGADQATGNY